MQKYPTIPFYNKSSKINTQNFPRLSTIKIIKSSILKKFIPLGEQGKHFWYYNSHTHTPVLLKLKRWNEQRKFLP